MVAKYRKIEKEYIDDLTDLYNRRYLFKFAPKELRRTQHSKIPLSIALIDLDYFKNVNDTFGHRHGDRVLREFGLLVRKLLRGDDSVFRYGGDEFVCLLPNANYSQAIEVARRIIRKCRVTELAEIKLTISIGVASSPEHGPPGDSRQPLSGCF